MQAALVGPLEIGQIDPATEALRLQAAPLIFGALLLAVVAVFLRLAVGQASRRSIGPAVAVVLAALVLAAAWLMTRNAGEPVPAAPKTEVAG
jgi:ribose transport system permease protein